MTPTEQTPDELQGQPSFIGFDYQILVTTADVSADLNPHCISEIGQKSQADGFSLKRKMESSPKRGK